MTSFNPSAETNKINQMIPRKILFGNPDKFNVKLSPNGQYLSYIAPKNGVLNIFIAPTNDLSKSLPITDDTGQGIRSYFWPYNNNYIVYSQDEKGDENTRLYSYNIETKEIKLLTARHGVKAFLYTIDKKYPSKLIIASNERNKNYFDALEVDLETGESKLMLENNRFTNLIFDNNLVPQIGKVTNSNGSVDYLKLSDQNTTPFLSISLEDAANTYIAGFDATNENIYLFDGRTSNTCILKIVNFKTLESQDLIYDPKADISIMTYHPTNHNIQAVLVDYDKPRYQILDKVIEQDFQYLSEAEHGQFIINTRTIDDSYWLLAYISDIAPVKYYLYDRQTKNAQFLFTNNSKLANCDLAVMHPVIIKSRDGLDLVSYLTLPNIVNTDGYIPEHPLPLILYVHGGPWARDSWGYDPTHQWLASRGYAVLSVNFRGSSGFGKDFLNAGNLQWGKKMHDDLIDSVNWVIDHKIAQSSKIAVMGGSYGGYATLASLTFTPDIFACGVDLVGPSNLLTLVKNAPAYWQPIISTFKKRMGGWETSEELEALAQISPINFVNNITKPLFIGHGANDPRVTQIESDQIVKAMQDSNIPVLYALYKDEGHGFIRPENRSSFYALAEQFLAKVLGMESEPIGSDLEGANFILNGKNVDASIATKLIADAITD